MLTFAQQKKITEKQAIEIAKALTAKQVINVYISKKIITSNTKISTLYKSFVAPNSKSYFIFIDEHPYQSWWHDSNLIQLNYNPNA